MLAIDGLGRGLYVRTSHPSWPAKLYVQSGHAPANIMRNAFRIVRPFWYMQREVRRLGDGMRQGGIDASKKFMQG